MKYLSFLTFLWILLYFPTISFAQETDQFFYNFDSVKDWSLPNGWQVKTEDSNNFLIGNLHSFATPLESYGELVSLEFKVKIIKGGFHTNILQIFEKFYSRYFIGLYSGSSYLQKEDGGNFTQILSSDLGISEGTWHNIKIILENEKLNIYTDNNLLFSQTIIKRNGTVSFEVFDDSEVYFDDVKIEMKKVPLIEITSPFVNGVHKGDLVLKGGEKLTLENGEFAQYGNIYVKDNSKLVLKNVGLKIERFEKPLNHWFVGISDKASLEINNSRVYPGEGALVVVQAEGSSRVYVTNSPTSIHLFQMGGNSRAEVRNSRIVFDIGGLVGSSGNADVKVINSTIGAVNFHLREGESFEASGLKTGFFKDWNLHRDLKVSGINYDLTLINTTLVKDELGPGPYERGWVFILDSNAKLKISDSELRKVVINLYDEKAEFANLSLEAPTNFNYKNITLENVIVKGQWGIWPHGSSDVVVRDSDAYWTFVYDDAKLTLINTHMNEFDPRKYHGTIEFQNSSWDTACEILENNNFTMMGSLKIDEVYCSWLDSNVTRIFPIIITKDRTPVENVTVSVDFQEQHQSKTTDRNGKVEIPITFNDTNYLELGKLTVNYDNKHVQYDISMFSDTPIQIELKLGTTQPIIVIASVLSVILVIIFVVYILLRRKLEKLYQK